MTKSRNSKHLKLSATAVGLALVLSACGAGETDDAGGEGADAAETRSAPPAPGKADGSVTLIAFQDPGTLDYVSNNQTALTTWIPGNVVEPLVEFDDAGEAEGLVAESWDISEDYTTYRFTIRDITFSTGEPVTADDVVYSLTAMQESPISTYAAAYAAVESIEATGDNEVTVQLEEPSQAFWRGMGGMAGLIQPEAHAEQIATNPIGTGPYVLDDYVTDDRFTFSANEDYWGEAPPLDTAVVRIIADSTAALNAMDAGEADGYPVINIDLWERLTSEGYDEAFNLITYPQAAVMRYVAFNQERPPFDDPAVRSALAKAIDREQIQTAFNAPWGSEATCGYGTEATSWFEPASADTCPHMTDPEAAAEEIAALGLDDTEIEFTSLSDVPNLAVTADVLVAQLQNAGAAVERNAIELAQYSQTVFQARPPQFGMTVMNGPTPIEAFSCPAPGEAGWQTYCSQEFTDLLNAADAATSVQEYDDLMAQANQVLKDDAVIVPLTAESGVGILHSDLQGWEEPKILNEIQFKYLHW